jgi:hypothetical protein
VVVQKPHERGSDMKNQPEALLVLHFDEVIDKCFEELPEEPPEEFSEPIMKSTFIVNVPARLAFAFIKDLKIPMPAVLSGLTRTKGESPYWCFRLRFPEYEKPIFMAGLNKFKAKNGLT